MARQSMLTKADPPKVDLILGEIALRQVLVTRNVVAKQLRALLDFVDLPNVKTTDWFRWHRARAAVKAGQIG